MRSDSESANPSISADGRHVAFASTADNLSGDAAAAESAIFVRDLDSGVTELVSRPSGSAGGASDYSQEPSISAEGRYVAFASTADLVPDDVDAAIKAKLLDPDVMIAPLLWLVSDAAAKVNGRRINAALWNDADPLAAAEEQSKAEEARGKAEFDALTIEEARTIWRNPPPRAPGEAWAHTELLRRKFCDEDHPQTADGQVCFLVGENWVRRSGGKEAGEYFEMACKLGVRAACERDEYKLRVAGRRQRADDVVSGAREAVAQNLKAPSQASWGAASIIDRSGSCNLVKLSVDAPNAFGVMLHSWWLVTITRQGEKLGVVTSGAGPSSFDHEPSDGEVKIYKKLSAWEQCR